MLFVSTLYSCAILSIKAEMNFTSSVPDLSEAVAARPSAQLRASPFGYTTQKACLSLSLSRCASFSSPAESTMKRQHQRNRLVSVVILGHMKFIAALSTIHL